jgi:hypothetical protein
MMADLHLYYVKRVVIGKLEIDGIGASLRLTVRCEDGHGGEREDRIILYPADPDMEIVFDRLMKEEDDG